MTRSKIMFKFKPKIVSLVIGSLLSSGAAIAEKRIALSFDDTPRTAGAFLTPDSRSLQLISALSRAKVAQAVFFINTGKFETPEGKGAENRIAAYTAAGHVIANHTATHPQLSKMAVETYLADVDAATHWLQGRAGYRPWFRFPFLDEGGNDKIKRDAVRAGLKQRGLSNGYVTIEASDWHMETLALEATQAGKTINMAALKTYFVQRHVEAANFYNDLAKQTLNRSPAHIMLLHDADVTALFVEDLVAALRQDGWTIITADTAYKDKIAKLLPDTPSAQGTLTEALAWQKGLPAPRWYRYNNVAQAKILFNAEVLSEK
jgi:peptidoglycan-N-acetylglucosamine deacetylase